MTTCIKCGKGIPDGELFCPECSLNLSGSAPAAARPAVSAPGRMQTPFRQPPAPRPEARHAPEAEVRPQKKSGRALTAAACLLAALGIGTACWLFAGRTQERRRVRLQEEAVAEREAALDDLEAEIDGLTQQLEEAEDNAAAQNAQIEALLASVSSAESSASQSQYDLSEQQRALEEATAENEALTQQIETLTAEHEAMQETYNSLQARYDRQSEQVKFVNSYVVFIEDDGTGCYHRYDCSRFLKKNFWAYSRKLAEKQGYTPCTECFGG